MLSRSGIDAASVRSLGGSSASQLVRCDRLRIFWLARQPEKKGAARTARALGI
ncbi:hypothetical protein [Microcoleus sp. AT3-D2]|uniref:hypothetical protein n=1 Tax=Microcoleus sp. AT3-D2 TaxID=2818612 RepID=UPI002FD74C3E